MKIKFPWRFFSLLGIVLAVVVLLGPAAAAAPTNPFFAMDTAFASHFRKNAPPLGEGLDLVKELGFAGVAWLEKEPDVLRSDLAEIERRRLRLFAIYCHAELTPEGGLSYPAHLLEIMDLLKGRAEIIWLHFSGEGPPIESLRGDELPVIRLRELAARAEANGLKIAIYQHFNEWTARLADAVRVAKLVDRPNFGVTFNLAHSLAAGDEDQIPALLEAARPVLLVATINGADSGVRAPDKQLWRKVIQPLGQGSYDVGIVLRKLREIEFAGPIGFQGYGIPGDPRSILAPTMQAWRRLSVAHLAGME